MWYLSPDARKVSSTKRKERKKITRFILVPSVLSIAAGIAAFGAVVIPKVPRK
jgi:hypothetical protein